MKKSSFVALIMGTVSGVLFALGMCMALLPEWDAFTEGIIFGSVGLVLGIVMGIICTSLGGKDTMEMAMTAIKCLCVQLGIVLLIYLGMFVYTAIVFDRHGNRRFERRKERIEV